MIKDKLDFKLIFSGLLLFIILVVLNGVSTILPSILSINQKNTQQNTLDKIESNTQAIKQAVNPYQTKDQLNKIILVQNFLNSTQGGQATQTYTKNLIVSGPFSIGYLFIKTSIDNKPLGSKGDIYSKLDVFSNGVYSEFGGLLIANYSLETPQFSDHSELLYSLSDIRYKKDFRDSDIEVISGNWLQLFNEGGIQQIIAFVSTTGQGKIIELSIYYQCSGGSNCSITIQ